MASGGDMRVVVSFDEESKNLIAKLITTLETYATKQTVVANGESRSLKDHPYLQPSTPNSEGAQDK